MKHIQAYLTLGCSIEFTTGTYNHFVIIMRKGQQKVKQTIPEHHGTDEGYLKDALEFMYSKLK